MKLLKIKNILLAVLPFMLVACSEEDLVTLNPDASVDPEVSATAIVLTKEGEGTNALTVSWPQPNYGFAASPTYFIQLDKAGGDFSSAIAVNNGNSLTKTFRVEELNRHLINLGFVPDEESELVIRVESRLSPSYSIISDPVTLDATAYTAFLDLSTTWGVVGSGYNNWGAFPDAPFFTTSTPNVLVAYVTLLDGDIKFRENNDWTNNYGDTGADGTLEEGGADIAVTAGPKKITWNTLTNTYTIEPYTWGIVGDAYNDWGNDGPDFPFVYDDATNQWRAVVNLLSGDFKIRKNNDWGTNYGDTGGDGTLELDGGNINVSAGKYLVTFNEVELTVTIEEIPHIWGLVGNAYNDWGNDGPDARFIPDWRNEGVWILRNVQLIDGNFKFRDSNDWGTNYGDNGGDGTLEPDGSDIAAEAGIYTITLDFSDPANPTWSSVKH